MISVSAIDEYVQNGYHVARNLVSPNEIAELQEDSIKLARGEYNCSSLPPVGGSVSNNQALKKILCVHQPHHVSPVILKYIKHPKICQCLGQIVGAHLPWWDGRVKCMQSMLFIKPPGFQGNPWHQDETAIPTRDRSLTGAWIALDDATVNNGCLMILPKSHQSGYLHHRRQTIDVDEYDDTGEAYDFDQSQLVPVGVKVGDVIFFNGYLMHGSKKNRSQKYRRALVYHYCNAWSLLPWKKAPAMADYRGVILINGEDPYAWTGTEELNAENVGLRRCKAVESD